MDGSDSKINRREFLQKSAVVAAGSAAINSTALSYARIAGANDRISLAHIGVGNRGCELEILRQGAACVAPSAGASGAEGCRRGRYIDAGALPFAGVEDDRGGRQ